MIKITSKYGFSALVSTTTVAVLVIVFAHYVAADRFSGLCPSSYPRQVSFNGTGRCYTVGSTGPCPKMMTVASNPFNPNFGQCRCKDLGSSCFGRPLLQWNEKCYFEFSQGPCRKGHWLVRGKQGYATCQKNPCPLIENQRDLLRTSLPRNNFYFTLQDNSFQCFKTGTQAFCGEGQRVYYLGSESFPRCVNYEPWECEHYSGSLSSSSSFGDRNTQSVTSRQGDPNRHHQRPAPGFGVPYDGI